MLSPSSQAALSPPQFIKARERRRGRRTAWGTVHDSQMGQQVACVQEEKAGKGAQVSGSARGRSAWGQGRCAPSPHQMHHQCDSS